MLFYINLKIECEILQYKSIFKHFNVRWDYSWLIAINLKNVWLIN